MPHAALWVVQHQRSSLEYSLPYSFNAARGFVGGAAMIINWVKGLLGRFNAARGFVGGAARERHVDPRASCRFNAARGFVGGAA